MDEVIIYQLPTGQQISQDLSRVGTIGSETGIISFASPEGQELGPYRIGRTHIKYIVHGYEVVGSITTIPLEAVDDSDAKSN